MGFSFSDAFGQITDAASSTLNAIGEGVTAGVVGGIKEFGAQPEAYNQPATGDNGAGGTVAQQQSPTVGVDGVQAQGMAAGLPSWVLPVGIGSGVLLVVGVIVLAVRK